MDKHATEPVALLRTELVIWGLLSYLVENIANIGEGDDRLARAYYVADLGVLLVVLDVIGIEHPTDAVLCD